MMKGRGSENVTDRYGNGTKETWRGWWWNRITERLAVRAKEAVVAYLCGPQDRDRTAAVGKGYRNHNLIAIDSEAQCVSSVRKGGGLAIQSDICEYLLDVGIPHDAISADFCRGLDCFGFYKTLFASPAVHRGTVIAMNFQRGRDQRATEIRKETIDRVERTAPVESMIMDERGVEWRKHRGVLAMNILANAAGRLARATGRSLSEVAPVDFNPAIYSYPSGNGRIYMDSIVFAWPWDTPFLYCAEGQPSKLQKERIAALKAVRTKMMRAA